MKKIFIGIMTGTSVDAIDIAALSINQEDHKLLKAKSYQFPNDLKKKILEISRNQIIQQNDQINSLSDELAYLYSKSINAFIDEFNFERKDINAIGLHGQTISHNPDDNYPSSIQIGNGKIVATETRLKVINDFRRADIFAGGQGAPLAPLFHNRFFHESGETRAVVNIGGIANISIFGGELIGYDIGPGNILIDSWCKEKKNEAFDKSGKWAEMGCLNNNLLNLLMKDDFIHKKPPKSSGTDYFNMKWIKDKLNHMNDQISDIDIQRTLTEFTANIIVNEINSYIEIDQIAICGGGVKNKFLMKLIKEKTSSQIIDIDSWGMSPDWVEAAGFAYLAYLRVKNTYVDLSQVTGSNKRVLLGVINTKEN